jgi:hypothetical protein
VTCDYGYILNITTRLFHEMGQYNPVKSKCLTLSVTRTIRKGSLSRAKLKSQRQEEENKRKTYPGDGYMHSLISSAQKPCKVSMIKTCKVPPYN